MWLSAFIIKEEIYFAFSCKRFPWRQREKSNTVSNLRTHKLICNQVIEFSNTNTQRCIAAKLVSGCCLCLTELWSAMNFGKPFLFLLQEEVCILYIVIAINETCCNKMWWEMWVGLGYEIPVHITRCRCEFWELLVDPSEQWIMGLLGWGWRLEDINLCKFCQS